MTKKIFFSLLILAILLPVHTNAQTYRNKQANSNDDHIKIHLITDINEIHPGEKFYIGIEQDIEPGWHTYWINPGDSGLTTTASWQVPEGFKTGELLFPTPKKIPFADLVNYGYEDKVTLLQEIKAPQIIPERELTFTVSVKNLVCKDICIPETDEQQITLNRSNDGTTPDIEKMAKALALTPKAVNWHATYKEDENSFIINISDPKEAPPQMLKEIEFFPEEWGLIDNTAKASIETKDNGLTIKIKRGNRALSEISKTKAVIAYHDNNSNNRKAVRILATQERTPETSHIQKNVQAQHPTTAKNLPAIMLFALLGGIILNFMPCVFPVLSMKALSLVKLKDKKRRTARINGIGYTLGIITSFLLISGILIFLKSTGQQIGWGFQLQSPITIAILAYLFLIIGLNLSGYFEIGTAMANLGNSWIQNNNGNDKNNKKAFTNAFATGILASIVATPCTAPFMGTAIGFALTQPAFISMLVFLFLGLGLALPYLLLCFFPPFGKILPSPGKWMETFRQFLAFPMFASAIWLLWVLNQQAGTSSLFVVINSMLCIILSIWLMKSGSETTTARRKNIITIFATILLICTFFLSLLHINNHKTATDTQPHRINEQKTFSNELLSSLLLEKNTPVFVNIGSEWCITCKFNERVAIDTPETKSLFKEKNITYLKGDWTNQDVEISKYLESFGRNGVPLYVYYPEDRKTSPVILPQILTKSIIKKAISEASKK